LSWLNDSCALARPFEHQDVAKFDRRSEGLVERVIPIPFAPRRERQAPEERSVDLGENLAGSCVEKPA
jgi:hypothetical protein